MTEWYFNIREEGSSLLSALALRVPSAPPGLLRQLCKKQRITVNNQTASADMIVHCGDAVAIKASQRWLEILGSCPIQPGDILYEDIQCLIVNKPAGLPTHRAHGYNDNLLLRAQNFLRLRGETFKIAPVQRLDIGTSGAVLIGKGKDATGRLGKLMMAGGINKTYLAVVHGEMSDQGDLNSPVSGKGRIKDALTRYRTLATANRHTLLELELVTGRRHQIRQQLADANHPLVDDKRYGNRSTGSRNRPMLHCHRLALQNPATDQAIDAICPPASDFCHRLHELGFLQQDMPGLLDKRVPSV